MRRIRCAVLVLGAAGALFGCDDAAGPSEPADDLQVDAVVQALVTSALVSGPMTEMAGATREGTTQFTRSASCPAGGSMGASGTRTMSLDEDTRVLTRTWSLVQTHENCARTVTRTEQSVTVTVNGSVTTTGTSTVQLPADRSGTRQILTYTATRTGSTTVTAGDRSRTCDVNLTETWDPATSTMRVTGSVCGREVDRTRSR